MILEKFLNDNTLVQHYSDQGFKLRQVETGHVYDEPIDINPCPYTYVETDEVIPGSDTKERDELINEQIDEIKNEILDTQEALCDIYEMLGADM